MKLVLLGKAPPVDVIVYYSGKGSKFIPRVVLKEISHRILAAPRGNKNANTLYLSFGVVTQFVRLLPLAIKNLPDLPGFEKLKLAIGNTIRVYQLATILAFRPKVVITSVDTSFDYQWMSRQVSYPKFYAIANSPRDETHIIDEMPHRLPHPGGVVHIPNYFVYGPNDRDVFVRHSQEIGKFHLVGPLRYGYYLTQLRKKPGAPVFDICLISQYVVQIFEGGDLPDVAESLKRLHTYLARYIEETGLKLVVALRSNTEKEINYFCSVFNNSAVLQANSFENMTTYHVMDRSRLIISHSSTAAQNAFGIGQRVLFTNYSKNKRLSFFAKGPWMDEDGEYISFCEKIERLLSMDSSEYNELTADARAKFMTFDPQRPAHDVIRSEILKEISVG
jgi:hypothetical protein